MAYYARIKWLNQISVKKDSSLERDTIVERVKGFFTEIGAGVPEIETGEVQDLFDGQGNKVSERFVKDAN